MLAHRGSYDFGQSDRNGIPKLPHSLGPSAVQCIIIRKRLQASRFSDAKVADAAVGPSEHVLSTGDTMYSSL